MALTPSERRGALAVVLLLFLGAANDLWRAAHPVRRVLATADAAARIAAIPAPGRPDSTTPPPAAPEARVDLNAAGPEELDRLPGIGPVLAGRIVEYRTRHGRFTRIEDLLAVRGIGPRLLERLRSRVRL